MEKSINQNGCSLCKEGKENYTTFEYKGQEMYQYDYRHPDGDLFSCCASSLEECRSKKDMWRAERGEIGT